MSGDPHGGGAAAAAAKSSSSSSSAHAAMNVFHSYHALGDEISKLQSERRIVEADTDSMRNEMGRLQTAIANMETTGKKATQQRDEWNRKLCELQNQQQQQQQQQQQEVGPTEESPPHEDGSATATTTTPATTPAAEGRPRSVGGGLSHKVKLEQLGRLVRESREAFLQESASFRTECRRLRQQASALGLAGACTVAFLGVHGVTIDDPNHHHDKDDKDGGALGMGLGPPSAGNELDDDDDDDDEDQFDGMGDPCQWTDSDLQGDDDETKELWQLCVASQSRLDQWENEREAAVAKLREWTETSETRRERVVHLEEQLNRVKKENDDLESQLKELQAKARATPSPLEAPRNEAVSVPPLSEPPPHKRARTDRSAPPRTTGAGDAAAPSTGMAPPRRAANPYAKKAPSTTTTTTTTGTGADVPWAARRSNLQAVVVGPARSRAAAAHPTTSSRHFRQHVDFDPPGHRRRRDKRFGCDLVVQDGTTLDASWDESPYTTPSPNHEGRGGSGGVMASATASSTPSPNPTESSAELPRGTRGFPTARITPAAAATPGSDTAHGSRPSSGFAVLADDEDDDDDLLLRPAWASGRK